MSENKIISINISKDKGTIKIPIKSCEVIENFGLANDAHASSDTNRQVSLLALKSYENGYKDYPCGSFGENITYSGDFLHNKAIGTIIKINECLLEITQIGKTCHAGCDISKETGKCVMPTDGIFCKVIKSGFIENGNLIEI